jgi:hypothetical protein
MAIDDVDIKKLWGLSAGHCNFPGCGIDCIPFLKNEDIVVIGEMAHIIARKAGGPRGEKGKEEDNTYDNLILLCPTHHTLIDKASENYSIDEIKEWKNQYEKKVADALLAPKYSNKKSMFDDIAKILIKNKAIWIQFGPESDEAKSNPYSNLYNVWSLRKIDTVIPNNKRIINFIKENEELLSRDEYAICCSFINHAEVFEQSNISRLENAPRFPREFEEMINGK